MSRARRSLRDRDEFAISPTTPQQPATDNTDPGAGSDTETSTESRAAGTATARGSGKTPAPSTPAARRSSMPAGGTQRIGIYFRTPGVFDQAKSAYLSDWEQLPDSADTFARWTADAIARHAARTSAQRRDLTAGLDRADGGAGDRGTRSFIISSDTRAAATAALAADGRAGRWSSLSEFAGEAIAVAVDEARSRAGGTLPPAPPRLPNRLHR